MPIIGVVAASVLTTVGLIAYLVLVARLALAYSQDPWLVQGGWVGVRIAGLSALCCAAVGINRVHDHFQARGPLEVAAREASSHLARGVAGYLTVWALSAGVAVLWVILAYWGAFQLGI